MSRQSYSALALIRRGLSGHLGWQKQWRKAEPKAGYDAVIVGGGGHGLGAAYYLAKEHGMTNIAVLEKGWIGGGNTGRNTTIIRSNYLFNESAALYDHSVKLWETLSQELNYNVMFSPRGVIMLAHTVHDIQVFKRHVHADRCNGVDNEWLEPAQAKGFCPPLNIGGNIRYPVLGAALQRRRGGSLGNVTRSHPYAQGGRIGGRQYERRFGPGRGALAFGELSVAGVGVRTDRTDFPVRGDVEHHSRLHQPIGQGRTRDRRRHRRVHVVYATRSAAYQQPCAGCHLRIVPDFSAPANAAQLGRHRRRDPGSLSHHREDPGEGPVRELRLGHGDRKSTRL